MRRTSSVLGGQQAAWPPGDTSHSVSPLPQQYPPTEHQVHALTSYYVPGVVLGAAWRDSMDRTGRGLCLGSLHSGGIQQQRVIFGGDNS